jgi:hypothetical protein
VCVYQKLLGNIKGLIGKLKHQLINDKFRYEFPSKKSLDMNWKVMRVECIIKACGFIKGCKEPSNIGLCFSLD